MLARREAELIRDSNPKFIRSLEAIKGRWKGQAHKDMVETFLEELRNPPEAISAGETEDLGDMFLDYLESLPRM